MAEQGQGRSSLAFFFAQAGRRPLPAFAAQTGRPPLEFLASRIRRRRWAEARINCAYAAWQKAHAPDLAAWSARCAALAARPRFSIVMPVWNTRASWLRQAIASVRAQIYDDWELLIADDASDDPACRAVLAGLAGDARMTVTRLAARLGISGASNAALAQARGDWVVFLDHDDVLVPHALAAMACHVAADPGLALVFSDEDQLVDGRRVAPYFKGGWNPDLLLSQNCVGHLAAYSRAALHAAGGLRPAFDGSQDWDLALRVTACLPPSRVRHIPEILYSWRQSPGSVSAAAAARCADAGRRALAEALGDAARITVDDALPQWPRVEFALPTPAPLVSLIGCDAPTAYAPIEIVPHVAAARGSVHVHLPAGAVPLAADWLEILLRQLGRPGVAAACGRLVDAGADLSDPGYRGLWRLPHTVSAACLPRAERVGAAGRIVCEPRCLFQREA